MTAVALTESPRAYYEPPGLPLVGQLFDALSDPIELFMRGMASGERVVRYRFGPYRYLLLNDPADVQHVLQDPNKSFGKSPSYHALKLILGKGLVTSEGELWKKQRKLAQPAFHHGSLVRFVDQMQGCTKDFAKQWQSLAAGTTFDVHEQMMQLTFRIVGQTLFSTDLSQAAGEVGEALAYLLKFAADRTESLLKIPTWAPTVGNHRFKKALAVVDEVIYQVIEQRRGMKDPPHDLLGLLMSADMPAEQLRDELVTLALAGHETTATALSWTWLLLSQHPDVARRARQEVLRVAEDQPINFSMLGQLQEVDRIVQESMRLYPPVWGLERQVRGDDQIAGQTAPKGDIVLMCQYSMHRDPRFWSNPEGFDPDRFLPERAQARPRFSYFPFGGGARICIGKAFAMMEAKLILAELLRSFELSLVPGFRTALDPGVTLRPKAGIHMTLKHITHGLGQPVGIAPDQAGGLSATQAARSPL